MIKKFFGHLSKVLRHKWWVFYYCCKAGIPMRGILHDMSKFSPAEFFENIKYYHKTKSPIVVCKEKNGYSKAWLHHRGRNKHHYEYWVDNLDHGGKPIIMPYKYTIEMLCDYLAAGKVYDGQKFTFQQEYQWWKKHRNTCAMHQVQKQFLDQTFSNLAMHGEMALAKNVLISNYYCAHNQYIVRQKFVSKEKD